MTPSIQPLISVVIPVRDRIDLLQRALRSVAAQTYPRIEILVIDDGSKIPIDPNVAEADGPVRILRHERSVGAQRARLSGAEAATGTFVALLDSDDWWHPTKLEHQMEIALASPDVIVSCRVIATRGTLRREAPWRPLESGEKVEDFLYVNRGMLQSSTMLAPRNMLVDLLRISADARVHNDTMLFLEAQHRRIRIVQMPEPLSFFDDNPRLDRVSYDLDRVQASEAWFRAVSPAWSPEAKRGFMLTDMVTRYVNAGQRRKAFMCLLHAYHPKLSLKQYFKKIAYVFFNGSPLRFLGVIHLCLLTF